jgi:hypothetical protein
MSEERAWISDLGRYVVAMKIDERGRKKPDAGGDKTERERVWERESIIRKAAPRSLKGLP